MEPIWRQWARNCFGARRFLRHATAAHCRPSFLSNLENIMSPTDKIMVDAEPYPFEFVPAACALLIIDMQRDFLEPGGFGEMLGNDISQLRRTIEPNQILLAAWREKGLQVLHTREGHRPDLGCLPPAKKIRGRTVQTIGDHGPMGRILVRGEIGHDII